MQGSPCNAMAMAGHGKRCTAVGATRAGQYVHMPSNVAHISTRSNHWCAHWGCPHGGHWILDHATEQRHRSLAAASASHQSIMPMRCFVYEGMRCGHTCPFSTSADHACKARYRYLSESRRAVRNTDERKTALLCLEWTSRAWLGAWPDRQAMSTCWLELKCRISEQMADVRPAELTSSRHDLVARLSGVAVAHKSRAARVDLSGNEQLCNASRASMTCSIVFVASCILAAAPLRSCGSLSARSLSSASADSGSSLDIGAVLPSSLVS